MFQSWIPLLLQNARICSECTHLLLCSLLFKLNQKKILSCTGNQIPKQLCQFQCGICIFTIQLIQVVVFWVMTGCSDLLGYKCFRGTCSMIWIFNTVKISNLANLVKSETELKSFQQCKTKDQFKCSFKAYVSIILVYREVKQLNWILNSSLQKMYYKKQTDTVKFYPFQSLPFIMLVILRSWYEFYTYFFKSVLTSI